MQGEGSKNIVAIVVAVALVILLFGLVGGGMLMGPGMMRWTGWGGLGFSPFGGILMMIVWVLIIAGAIALIVWLTQQGRPIESGPRAQGSSALNILQERYARGEITKEQFEQMRRDIEGK